MENGLSKGVREMRGSVVIVIGMLSTYDVIQVLSAMLSSIALLVIDVWGWVVKRRIFIYFAIPPDG